MWLGLSTFCAFKILQVSANQRENRLFKHKLYLRSDTSTLASHLLPCIDWFPNIYWEDKKLTMAGFWQHNENWFPDGNLALFAKFLHFKPHLLKKEKILTSEPFRMYTFAFLFAFFKTWKQKFKFRDNSFLQGSEEQVIIYLGAGGSKDKGHSKRTFIC